MIIEIKRSGRYEAYRFDIIPRSHKPEPHFWRLCEESESLPLVVTDNGVLLAYFCTSNRIALIPNSPESEEPDAETDGCITRG